MRNVMWRGIAIALAACIAALLWTWPEEKEQEPVIFSLDCPKNVPLSTERWEECKRAVLHGR